MADKLCDFVKNSRAISVPGLCGHDGRWTELEQRLLSKSSAAQGRGPASTRPLEDAAVQQCLSKSSSCLPFVTSPVISASHHPQVSSIYPRIAAFIPRSHKVETQILITTQRKCVCICLLILYLTVFHLCWKPNFSISKIF